MNPKNSGKAWSHSDVLQLSKLAQGNMPTRVIALKMQRSPVAIQSKASNELKSV